MDERLRRRLELRRSSAASRHRNRAREKKSGESQGWLEEETTAEEGETGMDKEADA